MQKATKSISWKWGALLAIILLAAFLRLYRIDSLPPGDSYDPAYYGVDALKILDGWRPIFLPTNEAGREALYSYWVTPWVALLGIGPLALHVASAVIGILTVPVMFLLGEEIFAEAEPFVQRFGGLIAAFATAVSYWHLNLSRFGVRAILVPLFSATTCYLLWRALRTESRHLFVAGGIVLGLCAYTYQVARLVPVLVVLAFLYIYHFPWRWSRRTWVNFLMVSLVAVLVFAPLGYYFLTHPGLFNARVNQVYVFSAYDNSSSNWDLLKQQVIDTLLFFNFRGDHEYMYTIPFRPALNPFFSVLFFSGIVMGLLHKKPRFFFILSWLVVMFIPGLLSHSGPAVKRLIGTFPPVMLLVALGGSALVDLLGRRNLVYRRVLIGMLSLGLLYSGIRTYREYFVIWARNPDLFVHFETGLTAMGEYIGTLSEEEDVYVSPPLPDHPSLVYNSGGRTDIVGYNGRVCTVVPERTTAPTTYLVIDGQDEHTLPLLEQYYPQGDYVDEGPLYYDKPYFLVYDIPADVTAQIRPQHSLDALWDDQIRLLGYDLTAERLAPGETLGVILYYQAQRRMDVDYTVFVHLWGPDVPAPQPESALLAQDDSQPCRRLYVTSDWRLEDIVRDHYTLTIPVDAQPGTYYVQMGFYQWPSMEQLPLTMPPDHGNPLILQTLEIE
jgi:hypothetical protein